MEQALSRAVTTATTLLASSGMRPLRWIADLIQNRNSQGKGILCSVICSMSCCLAVSTAYSSPLINVGFSGDNGQLSSYYSPITRELVVAATAWEDLFVSGNAFTLNVNVIFDNSPTANAGSLFSTVLYSTGPLSVFRQGAVDTVLTGVHNPSGPYDAAIHIGTSYLTNELWFDPNPANNDSVPIDKTDAESIFLHEFGHIFAFNGNRDQFTGALSTNAESEFDDLVSFINNSPYFTGSYAESVYGGPVPLTVGNIYHVGNPSGPGADLETYPGDLMNGNIFFRGSRYNISAVDAAIAADLGLVVEIAEPDTIAIFCVSLVGFWLTRCSRRSVEARI
jgi:hypothetical protein